jgi:hypothetical protein
MNLQRFAGFAERQRRGHIPAQAEGLGSGPKKIKRAESPKQDARDSTIFGD